MGFTNDGTGQLLYARSIRVSPIKIDREAEDIARV